MTNPDERRTPQHDPADSSPADGGNDSNISPNERGQSPNIDPADKDQPAEGGRDGGAADQASGDRGSGGAG